MWTPLADFWLFSIRTSGSAISPRGDLSHKFVNLQMWKIVSVRHTDDQKNRIRRHGGFLRDWRPIPKTPW
jgi:hypothetical protein